MSKPIQSSSLLINEDPLQVLPTLAEKVGLNEAIVLQQVHYWLRKSKNIIDDRKWTYDTYEEWQQKNFKFWSVKTVQRIFLSLEEQKLLISMQPEKRERRKWYTIDYDLLEKLASDTHTQAPGSQDLSSPPSGQDDLLHDDSLSLSDVTTCPDATGQIDLLGEDNLTSPSGQHDPLYIKDSENSSENSGELTHTVAARPPSNGNGAKACVCATLHRSKICDEERIRIASNMIGVHNPERYAMTTEARRGTYDAIFLKRQKELLNVSSPEGAPKRDTSRCPDCHGNVLWYPAGDTAEGRSKGVAKCDHPRLEEEINRLQSEEARVELARETHSEL